MPDSKSLVVWAQAQSHVFPPINRQNFHESTLCYQQTYGVQLLVYFVVLIFENPQSTQIL